LLKISDGQVVQKEQLYKRNIVVTETLPASTQVMLKKEGILKKLEPRFGGPLKSKR